MNKDFGLVLETAATAKVPMPATAAAYQMHVAEFNEDKEEDFSAVITLMERLARVGTSSAGNLSPAGTASGYTPSFRNQSKVLGSQREPPTPIFLPTLHAPPSPF